MNLRAPFPYFGGKSRVAHKVWQALGNPRHYMEPFFGSGAVLLSRPGYDPEKHIETVCDKDGFVANVWRALKFKPEETAEWADWPVNHADLTARRKRLMDEEGALLAGLVENDEWCDPQLAGYWIWGASCWIGDGFTTKGHGKTNRPTLTCANGINTKRPHLADGAHCKGVNSKIPDVSAKGARGINAQIPGIALTGGFAEVCKSDDIKIMKWFSALQSRLRKVRVVCGDWSRICGGNWQDNNGDFSAGIFFDPPYGVKDRADVYTQDDFKVSADVRAWALERGAKPTYRIVIAGYIEEHEELLSHGWRVEQWKASGGYANQGDNQGRKNALREALFYSPYCTENQLDLFGGVK